MSNLKICIGILALGLGVFSSSLPAWAKDQSDGQNVNKPEHCARCELARSERDNKAVQNELTANPSNPPAKTKKASE
jgi:hypothetical protein